MRRGSTPPPSCPAFAACFAAVVPVVYHLPLVFSAVVPVVQTVDTVQDVYHRDRVPTNVSVLKLENDDFVATITPQWGGRLWGLTNKHTGKPLFYDSKYFQPTNDALRQAYIEGGCEWK